MRQTDHGTCVTCPVNLIMGHVTKFVYIYVRKGIGHKLVRLRDKIVLYRATIESNLNSTKLYIDLSSTQTRVELIGGCSNSKNISRV